MPNIAYYLWIVDNRESLFERYTSLVYLFLLVFLDEKAVFSSRGDNVTRIICFVTRLLSNGMAVFYFCIIVKRNKIYAMSKHATSSRNFFSECYQQYWSIIRSYVAARITNLYEAEDLTQDVFVRLWEHKEFVAPQTVRALLFTIARNLITDKIRRYYKKEDFTAYAYYTQETYCNTTEEGIAFNELNLLHTSVVSALPDRRRKIYELGFYQDMPCPVIAEVLSLSVRTVEGQMLLARKTVRTSLREQYLKVG